MTMPNIPVYGGNAPSLYVQGLNLSYVGVNSFAVSAGQARNSNNLNDLICSAGCSVSSLVLGKVGGLDVGTLAASTLYYVHLIANSLDYPGQPNTGAIISLSESAPTLPYGYDMFRRIGAVYVNGSSDFAIFYQVGSGPLRRMWYDANIAVLSAGSSATFAAQSFAAYVPLSAQNVVLNASITPTAAGDAAALRPTGSSSSAGYVIFNGSVTAQAQEWQLEAPLSAAGSLDYKVVGALSLALAAYDDNL